MKINILFKSGQTATLQPGEPLPNRIIKTEDLSLITIEQEGEDGQIDELIIELYNTGTVARRQRKKVAVS